MLTIVYIILALWLLHAAFQVVWGLGEFFVGLAICAFWRTLWLLTFVVEGADKGCRWIWKLVSNR